MKKYLKEIFGILVVMVCTLLIVPNNVDAEAMSTEFKSLLTEDGKLIVRGVKPEESLDLEFLFEFLFLTDENGKYTNTGYGWNNFSDDMNTVDFTINMGEANEETHTVDIEYIYDKDIKVMVDGYLSKIPDDLEYFTVGDMEVINFWVNGKGDVENLINYSSELKNYFDYKNFTIDLRKGMDDKFETYASGIANFSYDKTIYGVRNGVGVSAKHIIYVDENTGTTKEELISAVQKRIDNYIGKDKVKVTFGGESVYNLYINEFDENITNYENELARITSQLEEALQNERIACADGYTAENIECLNAQNKRGQLTSDKMSTENMLRSERMFKEYFIENYKEEDGDYYFLKDAVNGYYFNAEIGEDKYLFIIVKDNDKMLTPITKTSDVKTDITISTLNTNIPLDTIISAKRLTTGSEYEKIVKILNLTDNLIFDLKLYSNSLEEYITKLSDGSFEVKIPIPENFKGKDLVIYYVDDNGKSVTYDVKVENGYAVFNTNHFSIYTLGYKDVSNPETFDGILSNMVIGIVSLIGLVSVVIYLKKKVM